VAVAGEVSAEQQVAEALGNLPTLVPPAPTPAPAGSSTMSTIPFIAAAVAVAAIAAVATITVKKRRAFAKQGTGSLPVANPTLADTYPAAASKHPDGRMNKHASNMSNHGDQGVDRAEETSVI
jgi:hypothetical protein